LTVLFCQNIAAQEADNEKTNAWKPVEGQHYKSINPKISPKPGITFYFWPGSASCYQLEHALQNWQQQHPEIIVKRIPLVKRPQWRLLAKSWLVAAGMDSNTKNRGELFLNELYQTIHIKSQPT